MSDWEDEYDADGVAIHSPATSSAPAQWKLQCDDRQNVFFGVNGNGFGASREVKSDGGDEGAVYQSWRGGGRQFTRSTDRGAPGRRTFNDEKLDSSLPVTITVENASVGRVIGRFLNK